MLSFYFSFYFISQKPEIGFLKLMSRHLTLGNFSEFNDLALVLTLWEPSRFDQNGLSLGKFSTWCPGFSEIIQSKAFKSLRLCAKYTALYPDLTDWEQRWFRCITKPFAVCQQVELKSFISLFLKLTAL